MFVAVRSVAFISACCLVSTCLAQTGDEPVSAFPAPGSSGNADNVKFIGGKDDQGNPVRLAKSTGHVSNYSEEKIPAYTLPDPLVMQDGRQVQSAEQWFNQRRPEILKFYRSQIYGHVPSNAPHVTWSVTESDPKARDGKATVKKISGRIGDKADAPAINLTLTIPNKSIPNDASKPIPLMLNISFGFPPGRAPTARAAYPRAAAPFDPITEVLGRGWGYATIAYSEIQPDLANTQTQGVVGYALKVGESKPAVDEWGGISAWAWGISRAIDYLETDPAINSKQIAITGASRLGKTVLWAGAQDERVAAVFAVVSGEMGASLIRRDWGETLDDMAQNFSWQFAGNLQKWVGRWNELPVDQHLLIALCAPRPVYINGGLSDQWSDPKGEFLAMVAASPVYQLLGAQGVGATELPPLDHPVTTGQLAFHYHSEGHRAVPKDWKAFLDFAERNFISTGK
ncbi:MAG: hypothetical protein ABL921_04880 [Pirellula sp.]